MGVNVSVGVNVIVGVKVSVGVNVTVGVCVTVGVSVSVGFSVAVLVGVNRDAVFVEDLAVAVKLYPGRVVTTIPIIKQIIMSPTIAKPTKRKIFQVLFIFFG